MKWKQKTANFSSDSQSASKASLLAVTEPLLPLSSQLWAAGFFYYGPYADKWDSHNRYPYTHGFNTHLNFARRRRQVATSIHFFTYKKGHNQS